MAAPTDPQRVYMLTLIGKPGDDPIHGIRHILKLALRRYGLRCVNAREIAPPENSLKPERTQANGNNSDSRHGGKNAFHRIPPDSTGNDRTGSQDSRASSTTDTTCSGPDGRKAQGLGS